jgi:hypothetical protein
VELISGDEVFAKIHRKYQPLPWRLPKG